MILLSLWIVFQIPTIYKRRINKNITRQAYLLEGFYNKRYFFPSTREPAYSNYSYSKSKLKTLHFFQLLKSKSSFKAFSSTPPTCRISQTSFSVWNFIFTALLTFKKFFVSLFVSAWPLQSLLYLTFRVVLREALSPDDLNWKYWYFILWSNLFFF